MQTTMPIAIPGGALQAIMGDGLLMTRDMHPEPEGTDFHDVIGAIFNDATKDEGPSKMPPVEAALPVQINVPAQPVLPVLIETPSPAAAPSGRDVPGALALPALPEPLADQVPTENMRQEPGMTTKALTASSKGYAQPDRTPASHFTIYTHESNALPDALRTDEGIMPTAEQRAAPPTANLGQMGKTKPLSVASVDNPSPDLDSNIIRFEGPVSVPPQRGELTHTKVQADPNREMKNEKKTGPNHDLLTETTPPNPKIRAGRPIAISRSSVQETAFRLQATQYPHLTPKEELSVPVMAQVPVARAQAQTNDLIPPMGDTIVALASNAGDAADAPIEVRTQPIELSPIRSTSGKIPEKIAPEARADSGPHGPEPALEPPIPPATDNSSLPLAHDSPQEEPQIISTGSVALVPSSGNAPQANMPPAHPSPIQQASTLLARLSTETPGQIELTLAPETLGRLHFDMRPEGAGLVITLSAERPETLDLMRRHLPELIAELKQAGVQAGSFSFGSWSEGRPAPPTPPTTEANAPFDGPPITPPLPVPRPTASSSQALDLRL